MRSLRVALLIALMATVLPFLLANPVLSQEACEQDSDCDDGLACTSDVCDPTNVNAAPVTGCVVEPNDAACNDSFSCTIELCDPGHAEADVVTGCVVAANDAACDDGDECTDNRCDPEAPGADETSGCTFPPADPLPGECSVSLDIDDNGQRRPLTDGVLIFRYLFEFRDDALIAGAVANGAPRDTAEEVEGYLASILPALDIDDDEILDPLTDGRLILRYLFGFRGSTLIDGAVGENAQRDTAEEIEGYLASIL